jgi:hypothetical protein
MTVIPAIREADSRRIAVEEHARQKVSETTSPSQNTNSKWWYIPLVTAMQEE